MNNSSQLEDELEARIINIYNCIESLQRALVNSSSGSRRRQAKRLCTAASDTNFQRLISDNIKPYWLGCLRELFELPVSLSVIDEIADRTMDILSDTFDKFHIKDDHYKLAMNALITPIIGSIMDEVQLSSASCGRQIRRKHLLHRLLRKRLDNHSDNSTQRNSVRNTCPNCAPSTQTQTQTSNHTQNPTQTQTQTQTQSRSQTQTQTQTQSRSQTQTQISVNGQSGNRGNRTNCTYNRRSTNSNGSRTDGQSWRIVCTNDTISIYDILFDALEIHAQTVSAPNLDIEAQIFHIINITHIVDVITREFREIKINLRTEFELESIGIDISNRKRFLECIRRYEGNINRLERLFEIDSPMSIFRKELRNIRVLCLTLKPLLDCNEQ